MSIRGRLIKPMAWCGSWPRRSPWSPGATSHSASFHLPPRRGAAFSPLRMTGDKSWASLAMWSIAILTMAGPFS